MKTGNREDYKPNLDQYLKLLDRDCFRDPERTISIFKDWVEGSTFDNLAEKYNFTRERGRQIIQKCERIILQAKDEQRKREDPESLINFLRDNGAPEEIIVRLYNCLVRHCYKHGFATYPEVQKDVEKAAKEFLLNATPDELKEVRNLGQRSKRAIGIVRLNVRKKERENNSLASFITKYGHLASDDKNIVTRIINCIRRDAFKNGFVRPSLYPDEIVYNKKFFEYGKRFLLKAPQEYMFTIRRFGRRALSVVNEVRKNYYAEQEEAV